MTTKNTKLAFAKRIIAAREDAGYETRYKFAKAAGVAYSTVSSIERGESSPSVETLVALMRAIDVEVVITFRPRK